jgi:hypothetical protein
MSWIHAWLPEASAQAVYILCVLFTNLLWWLGHQRHTVLLAVIQRAVAVVWRQRWAGQWWDGLRHLQRLQRL